MIPWEERSFIYMLCLLLPSSQHKLRANLSVACSEHTWYLRVYLPSSHLLLGQSPSFVLLNAWNTKFSSPSHFYCRSYLDDISYVYRRWEYSAWEQINQFEDITTTISERGKTPILLESEAQLLEGSKSDGRIYPNFWGEGPEKTCSEHWEGSHGVFFRWDLSKWRKDEALQKKNRRTMRCLKRKKWNLCDTYDC